MGKELSEVNAYNKLKTLCKLHTDFNRIPKSHYSHSTF